VLVALDEVAPFVFASEVVEFVDVGFSFGFEVANAGRATPIPTSTDTAPRAIGTQIPYNDLQRIELRLSGTIVSVIPIVLL